MRVLAIDPAGNKGKEGNGITGLAYFVDGKLIDATVIKAEDHSSIEEYWIGIGDAVVHGVDMVVCESYKLQAGKQMAQTWSALETPQLIGHIRMMAYLTAGVTFHFQDPSIKPRWSDEILERMGIIERKGKTKIWLYKGDIIIDHARDAIRHGLHFHKYGAGK